MSSDFLKYVSEKSEQEKRKFCADDFDIDEDSYEEDVEIPRQSYTARSMNKNRRSERSTASNMIEDTMSSIDGMKQVLYEKIDICCAQYGLYGLKVIETAITDALTNMIDGMKGTVRKSQLVSSKRSRDIDEEFDDLEENIKPKIAAKQNDHVIREDDLVDTNYSSDTMSTEVDDTAETVNEVVDVKQKRNNIIKNFVNSFTNDLDDIMTACDEDAQQRSSELSKQMFPTAMTEQQTEVTSNYTNEQQ